MANLPETSEHDLRVMGITPEMIRDALRATGMNVEGDIIGYYLPKNGDHGDSKIQRACNYAKSDWTLLEQRKPQIIDEHQYGQKFINFDGESPVDFQYSHAVTETTGIDYSQTKSFDVTVNANIPIGQSGAMIGFNATMSSSEVRSKSWSKSEQHQVSFPVTVPAHEGRLVKETTTETSVTFVEEARIGVQNAVGIEVDPAWYKPNIFCWFYNIQYVFPNKWASSYINRSVIDTSIDTSINKLLPSGDGNKDPVQGDIVDFSGQTIKKMEGLAPSPELHPEIGIGLGPQEPGPGPKVPHLISAKQNLTLDFDLGTGSVPVQKRADKTRTFWLRLGLELQKVLVPPGMGTITFIPSSQAPTTAKITVTYDSDKMKKLDLQNKIVAAARAINWEGRYDLHFS